MRRRRIGCAIALALGALLASCARSERSSPIVIEPEPPAPILTTTRSGLEVHWWLARDSDDAVADGLAAFLEPALPKNPALRDRWRAAGLRMVRAPLSELGRLQRDLPAMHLRRRDWIGWAPRWVEIFSGRRAGGDAPLIVEGRRQRFDPGTLRVLLRAWPEPGTPDHAIPFMRLELAVQLHQDLAPSAVDLLEAPRIIPEEEQGFVFNSLTLETVIEEGFVYLITAEAPDEQWSTRRAVAAGADSVTSGASDGAALQGDSADPTDEPDPPAPPRPTQFGPPVDSPMTIGQAMMTASDPESPLGAGKVIVAILPRAPERFELLPRYAPNQ